jgi:hypothetical protein
VRYVLCIGGWVLALAAVATAGWAVALAGPAGILQRPLGELWFKLDVGSLNLVQAVVERYIWPPLWDPVIASVLQIPAALFFAVPAVILVALCHFRRRGSRASA